MIETATIEVLTAEVRVLMVGSRQITLSVFAQLDSERPERIKPFGRVRTRTSTRDRLDVIGADSEGNLCRSWIHDDGFRCGYSGMGLEVLLRISDNPEIYRRLAPIAAEWEALPLIVLAGLR